MKMQKTLIASIALHICFVTAAFALSSGLFGGSSNRSVESVMFVNLTQGALEITDVRPSAAQVRAEPQKTVKRAPEQPLPVIKDKEAVTVVEKVTEAEIRDESETAETKAAGEIDDNISAEADRDGTADAGLPSDYDQEMIYASADISLGKGEYDIKGEGLLTPDNATIIRALIEKAKVYPFIARKRGIEGTAYVNFKITPSGLPEDITIAQGSGSRILDSATLKIVRRAAPFPYVKKSVNVAVTFARKEQ